MRTYRKAESIIWDSFQLYNTYISEVMIKIAKYCFRYPKNDFLKNPPGGTGLKNAWGAKLIDIYSHFVAILGNIHHTNFMQPVPLVFKAHPLLKLKAEVALSSP